MSLRICRNDSLDTRMGTGLALRTAWTTSCTEAAIWLREAEGSNEMEMMFGMHEDSW